MHETGRYSESVFNRGEDATAFFQGYFSDRRVLVLAGAGFDPRAALAVQELSEAGAAIDLHLVRERRPSPSQALMDASDRNLEIFRTSVPNCTVLDVEVFDRDGAIVGGRRAVSAVNNISTEGFDDLLVDLSALSIGTSFPIVRLLVDRYVNGIDKTNLHLTVAHHPTIDSAIRPIAGDRPGWVHGFGGGLGIDRDESPAKLWLPQLQFRGNQELGRIFEFVQPDDTCPIVPFPAEDPRLPDRLAMAFQKELLGAWEVDVRNLVYADEGDPLDVYRTILRIDDLRRPVFEQNGGSSIIVSPTGSKLMALGALMACTERDIPVAYLEAEEYEMDESHRSPETSSSLVHLWLEGEAYFDGRSEMRREV